MRGRRMGRSLVRTAATTAVVVGTAHAVSGSMDAHAASKQADQQAQADSQQAAYDAQAQSQQQAYEMQQMQLQMQQMQAQQAAAASAPVAAVAAAPAAAAGGISDDDMAKLKQLGDLHTAGILSDSEFEAAKQKILG